MSIIDPVQGHNRRVLWSYVGALFWALCLTRKKKAIEGIFPTHPANIIYKCNLFLQQWSPLARRKDADKLKHAQDRLLYVYVLAREPPATAPSG